MSDPLVSVKVAGLIPTPGGAGIFLTDDEKVMAIFVDSSVATAIGMALELGGVNVRTFGFEHSDAYLLCEVGVPKREGTDGGNVLLDGQGVEACGGSACAAEIMLIEGGKAEVGNLN